MTETFHKIGAMEYKVNHDEKVVYRKEVVSAHAGEAEKAQHPDGYKWLNTGGDYTKFANKFPAEATYEAPEDGNVPGKVIAEPSEDFSVEPDSTSDSPDQDDSHDDFTKARKLKGK
jgi:hypothetical protein